MSLRWGNILAPQWMGFSPVVAGCQDSEYDLAPPLAVVVGANSFSFGNQLAIDTDDFLVREIQWYVVPGDGSLNPQDLRVRIRDSRGKLFTTQFVQLIDLTGPLVPAWPLCQGSVLLFDFQNVNGSRSASVTVVLKGWRRKLCSTQPAVIPPYVPLWRRYTVPTEADTEIDDFEYPFTFKQAGAVDLLKVPIQTDNDADFLWRGLAGDWNTANNDVAVTGSVAVTFYDPLGVPLIQYPLLNPWGSLACGLFRESVFPNGGGVPFGFFPEIFIPRGGVVQVDLSFGGAATLRGSLRGVKVYRPCR